MNAAACVTPTSVSLRQRLFHAVEEPVEAPTAPLDITHTPTAQELLAHRVLQSLEEEKAESKRYSSAAEGHQHLELVCVERFMYMSNNLKYRENF